MMYFQSPELVISGIGILSAIGQGKEAFWNALIKGNHAFDILKREGRNNGSTFLGAEIPDFDLPERVSRRNSRDLSLTGQAALKTLDEIFQDAKLDEIDSRRLGIIIGGSNLQQRQLALTFAKYQDRSAYIRPQYALSFMDTDLCGLCTEEFSIKGMAYTLGGASASGQLAILHAAQAVQTGQVDYCIALGALMDLSFFELQAFRSIGAMGSDRFQDNPGRASRPFDLYRDGFIYGENCGAVVVESMKSAIARKTNIYARVAGGAIAMDANRNPNPSKEGELRAISQALQHARFSPKAIDYINPHGTGSKIGDEIELAAIQESNLSDAAINATKSITGHGLSAAGTVEVIATLLQMKESTLHPTRNLEHPLTPLFWAHEQPVYHNIKRALCLSFGFGGTNTALCLENY